jgi:hypothetical protein
VNLLACSLFRYVSYLANKLKLAKIQRKSKIYVFLFFGVSHGFYRDSCAWFYACGIQLASAYANYAGVIGVDTSYG